LQEWRRLNSSRPSTIRPLTNIDIEQYLRNVPYFRGVYSRNNLPNKPRVNESIIVNYNRSDQSGSHWVCILNNSKNDNIEFYDSFAVSPGKELVDYMKKGGKPIAYNSSQHQDMNAVTCGYWCILYILLRFRGHKQYDILHHFTPGQGGSNERQMIELFNKYFPTSL
jgi:hypothetical protein